MQGRKLKLVRNIRVSKENGRDLTTEEAHAIRLQIEPTDYIAGRLGAEIVATTQDIDVSGGKLRRKGMEEAIQMIRDGQADGVVVAHIDRFTRDTENGFRLLREIEDAGGVLVTPDEGVIDLTDPAKKMMLTIRFAVATEFRDRVKKNFGHVIERCVRDGKHVGPTPFGYVRDGERRLVPGPDAKYVVELFEMRAKSVAWSVVLEHFRANVRRKSGAWTLATLRKMVANRTYLGEVRWGDHQPMPGAHPAIISPELFARANGANGKRGRYNHREYLLSGMLRCAGCRYVMARSNNTHAAYVCKGKHGSGDCPAPASISAALVEPYVVELVKDAVADARLRVTPGGADVAALLAKRDELTAEIEEISCDLEMVREYGITAHKKLVARAKAELAAVEAEIHNSSLRDVGQLSEMVGRWEDLSVDEQRHVLRGAFDFFYVKRNDAKPGPGSVQVQRRVFPVFAGDSPEDLPRQGQIRPIVSFDPAVREAVA